MDDNKQSKCVLDKNILSSTHINFLFGAGVNGKALPQLSSFKKTEEKLKSCQVDTSMGIEDGIDHLNNETDRQDVANIFKEEFNEFYEKAVRSTSKETKSSFQNIDQLLRKTNAIVQETQNRNPSMKQVNIYTLNYDDFIERRLNNLGYLYNSISASNTSIKANLMDVIGFNYNTKDYIPTFMISKLHGDKDNPIIPGKEKYREMLNEKFFEIAFHMKEQLSRQNSILIVIGYSGHDGHINDILKDCLNAGLTIYWYKYINSEKVPFAKEGQVMVRGQDTSEANPSGFILKDTTQTCYEDMEKAWANQWEE